MHLDLQIAKELKTLDWSHGAARKGSPFEASAGAATSNTASSGGAEADAGTATSAPETATSLPPASPRPSSSAGATSPHGSPVKATAVGGANSSGDESSASAGGAGRTLAAALRSSIGGSTPENKALQDALLRAGAGDVRSVLHVMSEHVNGVNRKLRGMESERTR
jgi:hypothetical protein